METNTNLVAKNLDSKNILTLKIISFAMLMSVAMLGGLLVFLKKWQTDTILFKLLLDRLDVMILLSFGVVLLIVRTPIANLLFKKAILDPRNNKANSIFAAITVFQIVRLAMAEAAAVIGFQISIMYGESSSFVILGGAAIFAILREFPSESALNALIKLAQQAN